MVPSIHSSKRGVWSTGVVAQHGVKNWRVSENTKTIRHMAALSGALQHFRFSLTSLQCRIALRSGDQSARRGLTNLGPGKYQRELKPKNFCQGIRGSRVETPTTTDKRPILSHNFAQAVIHFQTPPQQEIINLETHSTIEKGSCCRHVDFASLYDLLPLSQDIPRPGAKHFQEQHFVFV